VEVVFPIEVPELKQRIIQEVLATSLADNAKARQLMPDGSWKRVEPGSVQVRTRSQERFLQIASQNAARRLNEVPPPPIPFVDPRTVSTRRPRKRQTS
jgi:polyphosphate kinase